MKLSETTAQAASPGEVTQVVEHFFRHEAGKMISTLTRIFGIEHLNRAEDVVQETLIRALQTWPYYGVPKNPSAWITQVAKNLALDLIRRDKIFRNKENEIVHLMEQVSADSKSADNGTGENGISDDRLRMMFTCCHPQIPQEMQVALALKTLCGFSPAEIARAFLISEAAVAKRLTRAKQRIREARIAFEIPADAQLIRRLDSVLQTLYLLFNEGYKASGGEHLIRAELCHEAIRLVALLAQHPAGDCPPVHGLLALMLLNGARLPARLDAEGNILLLEEQNRSQWDQSMIARGMYHLLEASAGDKVSEYHLQAAIAACHCAAPNYESTDWPRILSLYDRLIEMDDSPIVALNRAVAVSNVHGPRAGIEAVEAIHGREQLSGYYLLYAVLGEFEADLDHREAAMNHFRKALELATMKSEQNLLTKRIQELDDSDTNEVRRRRTAR
ncbi:MAG TPA: sigma-70 family RNA polymerase sigma factor [Candidatus Binatia bacterium]|nr:sigma-70 family RNA polymerase sigma factor [Candidatus Binatia bacterium]